MTVAATGPLAAPPPSRPLLRRTALVCVTLLCLVLPALVAGLGLGEPPRGHELARLQHAIAPASAPDRATNEVARQFFAFVVAGETVFPSEPGPQAQLLARARLGQVIGLFGVGLLLYLAVLLAHGRLQALLACAALAVLPPVLHEGHVLRPETPAALFAALSLVLLQCVAQQPRTGARRTVHTAGLLLCAMVASGLSFATLPISAAVLLVPGIVLCVAAVQLTVRSVRIGRRQGLARVPLRAINGRLLPWTAAALLWPVIALGLLAIVVSGPIDTLTATASTIAWLPEGLLARVAFALTFATGALAAILAVGMRFGRRGRIGADLVLFVFCAVTLAGGAGNGEGTDRLPLAVATAAVLAHGARTLLVLLQAAVQRAGRVTA